MKNKTAPITQKLIGENIGINGLSVFGYAINNPESLPLIEHSHKDKIEFLVVIDGIQKCMVSSIEFSVFPNDCIIIKQNEPHYCKNSVQEKSYLLWFQIDLSEENNFLGLSSSQAETIKKQLQMFNKRQIKLDQYIIEKLVLCLNLLNSKNPIDKIEAQSVFIFSLIEILKTKAVINTLSKDIEEAKEYIQLHIKEPIHIEELILHSDLTISEFKEKFKLQVGVFPKEYIYNEKIEKTKLLLTSSDANLYEIAYEYHFNSLRHFNVLFKKTTGYSPKEYRRKFKK